MNLARKQARSVVMRAALVTCVIAMGTVVLGGPPEKGVMAGRVIDAASKQPVPGAFVNLERGRKFGDWVPDDDDDSRDQVITGPTGEFRFAGLGPAEYSVSAWRDGYGEGGAAKTWPGGTNAPMALQKNQSITNLEIRLWPSSELTGRVVDELGRPFAGVHVKVVLESFTEGSAQFSGYGPSGSTDERGEYRFSVQPPGRVIVCANASYFSLAIPPLTPGLRSPDAAPPIGEYSDAPSMLISSDGRYLTRFELLPRLMTKTGESEAYVRTCAPSARSSSEATVVELKDGITVAPELVMRPERSVRVSGRLYGPGGPLGQTPLRLVPAIEERAYSYAELNAMTADDGTFAFPIVPSGSYRWRIDEHRSSGTVTPTASGVPYLNSSDVVMRDPNGYWLNESIDVGASHIDDVTLMARAGVTVSGTVIFDGSPPTGKPEARLSLKTTRERFGGSHAQTGEGGKFELKGVTPGEYGLEASASYFSLAEMTNGSTDLVDGPLVVGERGVRGLLIRFTSQPASISGEVRNTSASIVPNATVVVFPADPRARKTYGKEYLRIRSMRAVAGRYTFDALPPGDYYVAVIEDTLMARWLDAAFFASIERNAQRLFLQSGERANLNLVKR